MFLGERQDAEDAADPGGAVVPMDVVADRADRRAGPLARGQQRQRLERGPGRAVGVLDPMPAARDAQMLAEELARLRMEQPDLRGVPLDVDAPANPPWRCPIVGGGHLDAAIEMHRALAVLVVAKRFEGKRPQGRPFLGKHGGDLPLGGAWMRVSAQRVSQRSR